jgi:hypothetical protein
VGRLPDRRLPAVGVDDGVLAVQMMAEEPQEALVVVWDAGIRQDACFPE